MKCNLAVIKGDGIGPEIVTEAMKVLDKVGEVYGHTFDYEQILMGGCSIDATGVPLTDEAVAVAKSKDAVLLVTFSGRIKSCCRSIWHAYLISSKQIISWKSEDLRCHVSFSL